MRTIAQQVVADLHWRSREEVLIAGSAVHANVVLLNKMYGSLDFGRVDLIGNLTGGMAAVHYRISAHVNDSDPQATSDLRSGRRDAAAYLFPEQFRQRSVRHCQDYDRFRYLHRLSSALLSRRS